MDRFENIRKAGIGGRAWALAALLLTVLSPNHALADRFNTETSSSAEFLGMGNAAINTGRGPNSVFYNPASLASNNTKLILQPVNVQVDGNMGLLNQGLSVTSISNLSGLYNTLKNDRNDYVSGRYSIYPNVTFQYLSIGMLYEVNRGAEVRSVDNALTVRARDRFVPTMGASFRMFSGILRFGASLQLVTVGTADTVKTQPIVQSSLSYGKFIASGMGISKNFGTTVTLPFRYLPSFSVVARDVGGTKYSLPALVPFGELKNPAGQGMTIDLAASMTAYLARRVEFKGELDWKDMAQTLGGSPLQRIFIGGDLAFFDVMHLRAGMAHGYPSAGFGLSNRKTSINFAMYSDEFGDKLRGRADRHFAVQFTWGIY